jgi:phosphatidylinositol glycan class V
MLACARSQWALASVYFCLAGAFRSNGILLSGFILWGILVDPFVRERTVSHCFSITYLHLCLPSLKLAIKRVPYALLLTSLIFSPMIYHQYSGYRVFCQETDTPAQWCSNYPPSIYTYVQSKYWNVGFLRYWTLQQFPNLLLATPVLVLLSYHSTQSVRLFTNHLFDKAQPRSLSPFDSRSLAPHGIHAFVFTSILLFASHTQIILRFAASLPFTYWSAARLLVEHPRLGKWWVGWSVVWGAVSLVLWSTFLPPA